MSDSPWNSTRLSPVTQEVREEFERQNYIEILLATHWEKVSTKKMEQVIRLLLQKEEE